MADILMRGFPSVLVAGSLIFSAHSTSAQTTTFTRATCNSGVAISNGGLTLTAINNLTNQMNCRANVGKYQGKWYFRATPQGSSLGWTQAVGVANTSLNTTTSEMIGQSRTASAI